MHFSKRTEEGKGDKGVGIVQRVDTRVGNKREVEEHGKRREMVVHNKLEGTVRDGVIDCRTSVGKEHERDSGGSGSMSVARIDLRIGGEVR